MLEIKNVVKTYRPKKGVPVTALNNVSLSFAETGLVFILGKSGSGKSTLLNVIGGLDKADSGEFIIKGKSSINFTRNDFDAYRNTFIGFIFQEYNILNEFTVGQNIALAMELQGKKATKEALESILDQVDLTGYAGRKPNELSGGQKQRVAIARALIKEPEIIMADEPTGALDSNTGKQVFDTLKKLSEKKLVIVVSHDREFAEYYGDRVIELADGRIISDISKYKAKPDAKSDAINLVDDSIVHIKAGSELTDTDFEIIKEYLKKHEGEILISSDERSNKSFKQISMISDDGAKASFKETTEEDTPKRNFDKKESNFIKSKLPYKNSLKIGASSLKTKPMRLFFTILLSFIAFAMFGLADTFGSYNKYSAALTSMREAGVTYIAFSTEKQEIVQWDDETYIDYREFAGDDQSLTELKEATGIELYPIYKGIKKANSGNQGMQLPNISYPTSTFGSWYKTSVGGITEMDNTDISAMGYTVEGRMPEFDNEIAITRYQVEVYKKYGLTSSTDGTIIIEPDKMQNASDMIDKKIKFSFHPNNGEESLNNIEFTIVGVVDTLLPNKYDSLKGTDQSSGNMISDYLLESEFSTIINYGPHGLMFVNNGLLKKIIEENTKEDMGVEYTGRLSLRPSSVQEQGNLTSAIERMLKLSDMDTTTVTWLDGEKTELKENEIIATKGFYETVLYQIREIGGKRILPETTFRRPIKHGDPGYNGESYEIIEITASYLYTEETDFNNAANKYIENLEADLITRYIEKEGVPQTFKTKYSNKYGDPTQSRPNISEEKIWLNIYYNALSNFKYGSGEADFKGEEQIGANIVYKGVFSFLKEKNIFDIDKDVFLMSNNTEDEGSTVKIVGITTDEKLNDGSFIVVSDSVYSTSGAETKGLYSGFIGAMPKDSSVVRKIIEFSYDQEVSRGLRYTMRNQVTAALDDISGTIESFSKVFLYVGLGLALFAGLMLANFIAVSIANKKREIGILRAVGAKASDVFTIFFNESFIIAIINFILALVGAIVAAKFINKAFMNDLGISVALLSFGLRQVALMLVVSVGVALLASFFPVMAIARKQPIDSIQDR